MYQTIVKSILKSVSSSHAELTNWSLHCQLSYSIHTGHTKCKGENRQYIRLKIVQKPHVLSAPASTSGHVIPCSLRGRRRQCHRMSANNFRPLSISRKKCCTMYTAKSFFLFFVFSPVGVSLKKFAEAFYRGREREFKAVLRIGA